MDKALPSLGVGIGYREPILSELFLRRGSVDFLEIVADHYLDAPREKMKELELLSENFILVPHAINLSLGTAEGVDEDYLGKLAALVNWLDPPWWSEHIAFTRAGGVEIGHLSPLPRTRQAGDVFSRNVERVSERIHPPLILENITWLVDIPGAEMSEAQFVASVADQTGCGLLLDVTNMYTNAVNHGFDASAMLEVLPMDRVVQLHFAGGHTQEGVLIDSHGYATPDEVWDLMGSVVARAPVKGILLERDENIPPLDALLPELEQAREIGRRYRRWD